MECSAQTVSGNKDGHDYVDLGLPSGRLWATCNVGASKPTEYGDYFAWGEIQPKEDYVWSTYKYVLKDYQVLGDSLACLGIDKYTVVDSATNIVDSVLWYTKKGNFIGDNIKILEAKDDAATANWGIEWRMPTWQDLKELMYGCKWKWTNNFKRSGIAGFKGVSKKNGNIIFLPAAGYRSGYSSFYKEEDIGLHNGGKRGYYWSSSLYGDYSLVSYSLNFFSDNFFHDEKDRSTGLSIRAVVNN